MKEIRLLDAAHIVGDPQAHGEAVVIDELSRKLLEDEDGPMLDLLKGFHNAPIELPRRRAWRPDRERLMERFDGFLRRSGRLDRAV